jgi:HK97 family phage portal protein
MNLRDTLVRLLSRTAPASVDPEQRTSLTPMDDPNDYGWGPVRANSPTNYSRTGRSARLLGYEQHPTVSGCVRAIAEALAAVPVQTYTRKESDGSPTALPLNTPTRLVLDRPRLGMTRFQLWLLSATHYLLYGNAFWVLERAGRSSPKAIRLVHPENILLVILNPDTLEPAVYIWRDRQGRQHESLAEDIVHFKDGSGGDWLFGYPRAATALLEMASEREASDLVRQYLVNDGSPGHIALVTDGATTRDAKAAEAQWRAGMVGRGERGSVKFLQGVKDWKVVGFNLEQLEFPALRSLSRESICTAFGVDPRLVGANSAKGSEGLSSGQGYTEARRRLYSQTVIPTMRNMESTLDADFGVEWGFVFCRFDPDVLADLTETDTERATRTGMMMKDGGLTRQEYRRMNRLPEEMVPTDTLVGSMGRLEYPVAASGAIAAAAGAGGAAAGEGEDPAALPAGQDPKALPPGKGAPALGADAVVQDTALNGAQISALLELLQDVARDQIPEGTAQAVISAAFPTLTTEQISAMLQGLPGYAPDPTPVAPVAGAGGAPPPEAKPKAPDDAQRTAPIVMTQPRRFLKRGMVLSKEARAEAWIRFDAQVQKVEVPYRVAAEALLLHERQEIVGTLMAHPDGKAERAAPDPILTEAAKRIRKNYKPGGKYHQAWVDRYRSLIGETIITSGQDVAAAIGVSFSLQNPNVQQAIADRALALATQVCDYSSSTITSIISEGQRQGLGVREVAKLLQSTLQGMEPVRAIRIARTETVGSLNEGEFLSAQQSEILVEKEWLCEFNNSRESHMDLDGTRIPMAEAYDNGLMFPGDKSGDADEVINCACSQLFYD